jgi:hypothetical protein
VSWAKVNDETATVVNNRYFEKPFKSHLLRYVALTIYLSRARNNSTKLHANILM